MGRPDPQHRRHRGAAVPAPDGERQAVALRQPAGPVRRLRLARRARHRRVRRRAVRARPRPRADPAAGVDLPSVDAERRRRPPASTSTIRPPGCRRARWSRGRRPPACAGPIGLKPDRRRADHRAVDTDSRMDAARRHAARCHVGPASPLAARARVGARPRPALDQAPRRLPAASHELRRRRADRRARRAGDLAAPRASLARRGLLPLAADLLGDHRPPLARPDRGALPLLRRRHAVRALRGVGPVLPGLPLRRPAPHRDGRAHPDGGVRRTAATRCSGPACTAASSSPWASPTPSPGGSTRTPAPRRCGRAPSSAPRSTTRRPAWCSRPSTATSSASTPRSSPSPGTRARTWPAGR